MLRFFSFWINLFICVFSFTYVFAQVEFSSSNLPIVIINTNGQEIPYDDPRIVADMNIIYNGNGQRNNVTDTPNNYSGKISIEIRGQSSAGWDKKSYALETQDAAGENNNVSLLDMPEENDWILHAPYYDRSLLRNVLVYRLSREMGWYSSRTRYCELILNGEYNGIYVLMEKIKRDKKRVAIAKLEPDEISGDDLTGGYILKIDKEAWKPGFDSPYPPYEGSSVRLRYQYHYPKDDDIVPEQQTYIRDFIYEFEATMNDANYTDPQTGYSNYINTTSFIDYIFLNELSRNVDGYRLSSYLYKDKDSDGGKIFAGPVWDYNFSFGNVGYYDSWLTEGWQLLYFADNEDFHNSDSYLMPFWWKRLFEAKSFVNEMKSRWAELRQTILSEDNIFGIIDMFADSTAEARERNFQIWPGPGDSDLGGGWFPPNAPDVTIESYADEIEYLKSWITTRLNWMDREIPNLTNLNSDHESHLAIKSQLLQNYPNPFNPETTIPVQIKTSGLASIQIFNNAGKLVRVVENKILKPGYYEYHLQSNDLAGGIYYVHLCQGSTRDTKKMLLLK